MSSDECVKVAVRIRPLVNSELSRGCESIVRKTPHHPQITVVSGGKQNDVFTYNFVFAPEDTQEMVYENTVRTMVLKLFQGYNVTILAYGQTGSGKTHTMGTAYDGNLTDDVGVIPRAVTDIFNQIDEMSNHEFTINCAFMELYQERLYDLLSSNARDQSVVDIREVDGRIVIPNLTEVVVNTAQETTDCLIKGSADRAVGATAMNAASSRNAIFTITIQKVPKDNPSAATISKFHLVDLAGSERSKKTLTTGEQFKEGVKINQGLLALGNVISALGSANNTNAHIGYRDSKLTRLLQDSLGGNSMTLMIACVSPADYNMEETVGTLRYADRARRIKNKPIVNEDPTRAEINRLKAEVQMLRMKALTDGTADGILVQKCMECEKPPTKAELQKHLREMSEKLQNTLFDVAHREHIITEYEETIETLNKKIGELNQQIGDLNKALSDDISPEDLETCKESIRQLTNTINDLNIHWNERQNSILESTSASDSPLILSRSSLANQEEELVESNNRYIKQQTGYRDELNNIKAQLAMKEELRKKLFGNLEQFRSIEEENEDSAKVPDYEATIAKLEKEKDELKDLLRNKNSSVSVKLAEERRKRVQDLEAQINEMKKKNKHQAQLLKQREKDGEKITKLNTEIQEMKQLKVKLIRKMKSESEEFRQWRMAREKELVQLRAKDRKMQTEAAKKDLLHEKQRNVLKRKVEEANAANKRLKDALQKQQKSKSAKPAFNRSSSWINDEIEVITSIVDMKQSFEQLAEVRAALIKRRNQLTRTRPRDEVEIKAVEEEIQMRNAQIADFGDKINSNDLDAKIKNIFEGIQSVAEGRSVVKHLLTNIIESRTSFNMYFTQARDAKQLLEASEEKFQQTELDLKQQIEDLVKERNEMEKEHETQKSELLHALSSKGPESSKIAALQETLAAKEEELEGMRRLLEEHALPAARKRSRVQKIIDDDIYLNLTSDSFDDDDDDDTVDPDWRNTPMEKRESKRIASRTLSTVSNETVDSEHPSKVTKRNKCSCKTGCLKTCGCRRSSSTCYEKCFCKGRCNNEFNESNNNGSTKRSLESEYGTADEQMDLDNDKENKQEPHTPKKLRVDDDNLSTYIYSVKKRNPLLSDLN